MTQPFAYPKSAAFGRIVAKEAIYKHSTVSTSLKGLFVRQIERISWQFKLAPETINLPGTYAVPEIQIFSIQLKEGECASELLACIDKAVQFPVLFELCYQDQVQRVAAYKRPADLADIGDNPVKWVVSRHFASPWLAADSSRATIPQVLNLEMLYVALLRPLLPHLARPGETLAEQIMRIEAIDALEQEIERCATRLHREKQFNRKIAINQALRALQAQRKLLKQ